jgi:hypothetical protein
MMLVTVQQAQDHLRIDDDSLNASEITVYIKAASQAIVRYLGAGADVFFDANGDPIFDSSDLLDGYEDVQSAVLLLIGYLYKNRDNNQGNEFSNYLPAPVIALLYPLRDPTIV